jgi:hypothetical protein
MLLKSDNTEVMTLIADNFPVEVNMTATGISNNIETFSYGRMRAIFLSVYNFGTHRREISGKPVNITNISETLNANFSASFIFYYIANEKILH